MEERSKHRPPTTYILRLSFALVGLLFILLLAVRGIYQIVFTIASCSGNIAGLVTSGSAGQSGHWEAIISVLKQSPGSFFDTLLLACTFLVFLHGALGIYYAATTKYGRFRDNRLFFLQILSAIAAGFILVAFLSPAREPSAHPIAFWFICLLISGLGSFHIGNGLYNACITLGISVSSRTKSVFKALSWVVAVLSLIQIVVLFI